MSCALPSCSHSRLTKRRGIFYFRRLLPALPRREVAVSLRTRRFREAEHRAVVAGAAFDAAWEKVKAMDGQGAQVATIVREYLREALARDMDLRCQSRSEALYANRLGGPLSPDPLDDDL